VGGAVRHEAIVPLALGLLLRRCGSRISFRGTGPRPNRLGFLLRRARLREAHVETDAPGRPARVAGPRHPVSNGVYDCQAIFAATSAVAPSD
jgi:hypothetical protein